MKQGLKTVTGRTIPCGEGEAPKYVKKESKMPYNEGYFDIVDESSSEKNNTVVHQSTEAYYNTIASGSTHITSHVAFIVGAVAALYGNF